MSYRYEAAPGYQAPRRASRPAPQPVQSTSSHYRSFSAPGPSVSSRVETSSRTTSERWQAAQAPTIHIPVDTRSKGVRFARPGENTSPAYLQPGQSYVPATPVSPHSAYTASPRAPSLSHSTDAEHEDDMECPPTPESSPVPLPRAELKASKSKPKASAPAPAPTPSAHQGSYSTIDKITYEMNSLVLSFQYPRDLEFESAPLDRHTVPKLTFAAKNRPMLEQNQKLESLQTKLDAVESHGDANVRKARKDAVAEIERALEDLKRVQAMVWNKYVYEQRKKRHT